MKRRQLIFASGALLLLPGLARAACSATRSDALGPFFVKDALLQSDMCAAASDHERLTVGDVRDRCGTPRMRALGSRSAAAPVAVA